MPPVPTFFCCYPREARGPYLKRFFADLEEKLANFAGIRLTDEQRLATIDDRTRQGRDWDTALSTGVATNHALLALYMPHLFNSENCGKELAAFLRRSPALGIDINGALTGAQNVLPVRWLEREAYMDGVDPNGRIPPFLRRIEWSPPDHGRSAHRTRAIERYLERGLRRVVGTHYYEELLTLLADAIRSMPALPACPVPDYATMENAFECDWTTYFDRVELAPAAGAGPAPPRLQPWPMIAVHAVQAQPLGLFPAAGAAPDGPALRDDLIDAAREVGVTLDYAPVPFATAAGLLQHVQALQATGNALIVLVDGAMWGAWARAGEDYTLQALADGAWQGPLLAAGARGALPAASLPAGATILPDRAWPRLEMLQTALVQARGRAMLDAARAAAGTRPVPRLNNSPADGAPL